MAYVAGDKILDDEYNNFLNGTTAGNYGINYIMGTGALDLGLGQTELVAVTAGQTVTATQWNSLFTAMDNISNHTNDTLTSTAARSAGDSVAIKSALNTDLQTLATSVQAGATGATAIAESGELQSSVSSTRWNGNHTVEHSITFANNAALRYFFNSGGTMRMKFTRTANGGGSATSKDSSVDELITATGNFDLKAETSTRSGSGETLTTDGLALGIFDLTTSYQTLMRLTQASGTYTTMYVDIQAKLNAAIASAVTVTMKYILIDPDGGDEAYQSPNTSSVDQYANYIGTTDFALHTVNPTTAQGLASVAAIASSAVVSNNTA
jgi:hypothetical protein